MHPSCRGRDAHPATAAAPDPEPGAGRGEPAQCHMLLQRQCHCAGQLPDSARTAMNPAKSPCHTVRASRPARQAAANDRGHDRPKQLNGKAGCPVHQAAGPPRNGGNGKPAPALSKECPTEPAHPACCRCKAYACAYLRCQNGHHVGRLEGRLHLHEHLQGCLCVCLQNPPAKAAQLSAGTMILWTLTLTGNSWAVTARHSVSRIASGNASIGRALQFGNQFYH